MTNDRAIHIIRSGGERYRQVCGRVWLQIGGQLFLDAHAADLKIVIVRSVICDMKRDISCRKRGRHVDVELILAHIYGGRIARARKRHSIGRVLRA